MHTETVLDNSILSVDSLKLHLEPHEHSENEEISHIDVSFPELLNSQTDFLFLQTFDLSEKPEILSQLLKFLDLSQLLEFLDISQLLKFLDLSQLLEFLDISQLLKFFDLSQLLEFLDLS